MLRKTFGRLGKQPLWKWSFPIYLVFLVALYLDQGLVTDKEALKYSGCASDVLQGNFSDLLGRHRLFSAYILFLVPFTALGSAALAIPAQILLMCWASRALHSMLVRLKVMTRTAHLFSMVFLLAHPIQCWVLSLYSEAFFVPIAILFLERSSRGRTIDAGMVALALLTLFARPTGALFVVPPILWWLSHHVPNSANLVRRGGLFTLLAAMAFTPVLDHEQLQVVVGSPVICGFPEHPEATASFKGSTLAEAQVHVIEEQGLTYWAGLFLRRSASLLFPFRSFFSPLHNSLNLLLILLYPLALLGIRRTWGVPFIKLTTAVLVLNILLVGATYDEWGARFLAPLLPLVIMLAAAGTVPLASIRQREQRPADPLMD